ncbi:hypothetical protein ACQR1I_36255 [Bradyrhizobium sp. HKCCYLS2038]|uniref:hypothetical protein n=1 Tax=Bradyrhizobium sp. HKCCYLS2038 TaxID=3420764 RepID=UPI003EBADCC0
MSTLYRSPDLIVDEHEWHIRVFKVDGRTFMRFYFRPLKLKPTPWQRIEFWQGPKPKRLGHKLAKYRKHAEIAMRADATRRAAVAASLRDLAA